MPLPDPNEVIETEISGSLDYLTDNSVAVQRISLAVYRKLAEGAPVGRDNVADMLGTDAESVFETLRTFPSSTIDYDAEGRIVGFMGLSVAPAKHRILVQGKTLYTWCVFDALFLAEILGCDLTVQTRCPASNTEIEVHVTPAGVESSKPSEVVMSVVAPDAASCRADLRSAFCDHVSFFENETAFLNWKGERSGVRSVGLADAFAMGQARNRMRFPGIEYLA